MKTPRIHFANSLEVGALLELEPGAANHVTRVLRMQPGDGLVVFNGDGGEFQCILERTERSRAWLRVGEFVNRELESPLTVILAQGISKGERMDYTVQKAVELGVTEIVPIVTARTVVQLKGDRQDKRRQHWQAVAASACEQCGRNRVPKVHVPVTLNSWLQEWSSDATGLLLDHRAEAGLRQLKAPGGPVTLLVGPEGGLAPQEVEHARKAGLTGIRLGPRVLRTETAAIAMLAALQTVWGDFS